MLTQSHVSVDFPGTNIVLINKKRLYSLVLMLFQVHGPKPLSGFQLSTADHE